VSYSKFFFNELQRCLAAGLDLQHRRKEYRGPKLGAKNWCWEEPVKMKQGFVAENWYPDKYANWDTWGDW
jgi:hypothetical protein